MGEERSRTLSAKELQRMVVLEAVPLLEEATPRPQTRAECAEGERPCPFVSCKYHLYLDVSAKTGAIKLNFPDIEVEDMLVSCALDVADSGGTTLEGVGGLLNLTRERARQIETQALVQLRRKLNGTEAPPLDED